MGEILGAIILAGGHPLLNQTFEFMPLKVVAEGDVSIIGQLLIDENQTKMVKILCSINPEAYYEQFANILGAKQLSAVIASFVEEKGTWATQPNRTCTINHLAN